MSTYPENSRSILLTNINGTGKNLMVFTSLPLETITTALGRKGFSWVDACEVPPQERQYYLHEPCWLTIEDERRVMKVANERLTLREFADQHDLRYLWIRSQTWPAGQDWTVQTGPDVPDEDYLESIEELPDWEKVADLVGTIDEHGRWLWDGEGDPCDSSGGVIYSVVAGWAVSEPAGL